MALAAESAARDSKILQEQSLEVPVRQPEQSTEDKSIHHVGQRPTRKPTKSRNSQQHSGQQTDCYRCAGKHQPSKCRFKEYKCHFCKKIGHLASVCRKKKQTTTGSPKNEQANHIEQTTDSSEDDVEYTLYHINSGSNQPLVVDVKLNGIAHPMEVDTGASVSLMSEESFQTMKESGLILNTTKVKLSTYTGEVIAVAGTANVTMEHTVKGWNSH